jgi:NTP pyrophosphatase (non-canonical NTP hydrolase)
MNLQEYQEKTRSFSNHDLTLQQYMDRDAIKLKTESCEVLDLLEKIMYQDHKPDPAKFKNELGDFLFYVIDINARLDLQLHTRQDLIEQACLRGKLDPQEMVRHLFGLARPTVDLALNMFIASAEQLSDSLVRINAQGFLSHYWTHTWIQALLEECYFAFCCLCYDLGVTPEEVRNANIEKLYKRYPSGVFTKEDSLQRRDQRS